MKAMRLMLNQASPEDYVVATGQTHTVREFCEVAFRAAGYSLDWIGSGLDERGLDSKTGKALVTVNKAFYRSAEVDLLIGNPAKARARLGWKPEVDFDGLVGMMVENDLKEVADVSPR